MVFQVSRNYDKSQMTVGLRPNKAHALQAKDLESLWYITELGKID